MFRRTASTIQNDVTLMAFVAQLQRPQRTRSTRRMHRRLRLLLRINFFSKRYTQRLHATLQRCPDMTRTIDALRRPFESHEYKEFLHCALNEAYNVPHLGRSCVGTSGQI